MARFIGDPFPFEAICNISCVFSEVSYVAFQGPFAPSVSLYVIRFVRRFLPKLFDSFKFLWDVSLLFKMSDNDGICLGMAGTLFALKEMDP
jgi:hypothetical protein